MSADVLIRTPLVPTDSVAAVEALKVTTVPVTAFVPSAPRMDPPAVAAIVTVLAVDVTTSIVASPAPAVTVIVESA